MAAGWEFELHITHLRRPRSGAIGPVACGFCEHLLTACARCCPPFAGRLRTRYGPGSVPVGRGRLLHSGREDQGWDGRTARWNRQGRFIRG